MVTIILLGSLLLGSAYEWYASWMNKRGKQLFESIHKIFENSLGNNFISLLYNHPEIHLLKNKGEWPSYIHKDSFAKIILDLIVEDYKQKQTIIKYNNFNPTFENTYSNLSKSELLQNAILNLEPSNLKTILTTNFIDSNQIDYYENIEKHLATWYDNYQERVTGWYKRSVQRQSFWAGLIFCIFTNFNLIDVYIELKKNVHFQEMTILLGEKMLASNAEDLQNESYETWKNEVDSLREYNFPFGYKITPATNEYIEKGEFINAITNYNGSIFNELYDLNFKWHTILGWIISALMLTIQSSFWFELLVRLFNIRKTGIKPEEPNK